MRLNGTQSASIELRRSAGCSTLSPMRSALLILLVALSCVAQDSKLQELDRQIAAKEKELAELKANRARLAGSNATPQERAMWADPAYATAVSELQIKRPILGTLKKRDEQVSKQREIAGQASGMSAADFARTAKYKEYSDQLRTLRAQRYSVEATIAACDLKLMELRQKYGVPEPEK